MWTPADPIAQTASQQPVLPPTLRQRTLFEKKKKKRWPGPERGCVIIFSSKSMTLYSKMKKTIASDTGILFRLPLMNVMFSALFQRSHKFVKHFNYYWRLACVCNMFFLENNGGVFWKIKWINNKCLK